MTRVLEIDCTMMGMYLTLNYICEEMVAMVNFMLCTFDQSKNNNNKELLLNDSTFLPQLPLQNELKTWVLIPELLIHELGDIEKLTKTSKPDLLHE